MLRRNSCRCLTSLRLSSTTTPITQHSYIQEYLSDSSKEEITKHLKNLGPFPTHSPILNPQHFYQNAVLLDYSKKQPHSVSLQQLAGFGSALTEQKVIDSANFVRTELPIRLALRIRELQSLPFGVVNNYHIAQVYQSYYFTFNYLRKVPKIRTLDDNQRLCSKIASLLDGGVRNLSHLMMGALEVSISDALGKDDLDALMRNLLMSRMARRMMLQQHVSISNKKSAPHFIGEMLQECRPAEMLRSSMSDGRVPLQIDGDLETSLRFMAPHLKYMFHEILRNSVEATIKTHSTKTSKLLPPVKVTIVDSEKHVLFRISDQGGGIRHDKLKSIWSFGKPPDSARKSLANFHHIPGLQLYSNLKVTPAGSSIVTPQAQQAMQHTSLSESAGKKTSLDHLMARPLNYHLGVGLPMCSVYADYWNGSLTMNSLDGYGSDTSLTLRKLDNHSNIIRLDRA